MAYRDLERRKRYVSEYRKAKRRERGLQKQGRKPHTEAEAAAARVRRREYEKKWREKQDRYRTEKLLLWASRRRAKNRGLEHTIVESDIVVPEYCPYLGIKLQLEARKKGTNRDAWPTLDRIDNTKGYIPGNVEVISFKANTMKNNATEEELIMFARRILNL